MSYVGQKSSHESVLRYEKPSKINMIGAWSSGMIGVSKIGKYGIQLNRKYIAKP